MTLPKTLYARMGKDTDGTSYVTADAEMAEVIDEDGPSTIGVYQLVETVKAEKTVRVTPAKKARR